MNWTGHSGPSNARLIGVYCMSVSTVSFIFAIKVNQNGIGYNTPECFGMYRVSTKSLSLTW